MGTTASGTNRLASIEEDTVGPYYPYSFIDGDRSDLTVVHRGLSVRAAGQRVLFTGRLVDSHGDYVPDAIVELWQANAAGVLRTPANHGHPDLDPYFDGFGRLMTSGEPFVFRTVKPGCIAASASAAARAPHVTLTIFSDGVTRLVTQIFFEDESIANDADPVLTSLPAHLRERLIARKVRSDAAETAYEFSIVMSGEGETPFFDDLLS